MKEIHIALVGNPNSGKTSTFNVLTGAAQYVGNWPGVTVERKSGKWRKDKNVIIQDLPGIYSLSPYTPEEVVSRNYLLQDRPDVILNIIDGTNLERNLYLTTQLMETGIPMVLAVNMMDLIKKRKQSLNLEKMSYALGMPVIGVSALKNQGIAEMMAACLKAAGSHEQQLPVYDERLNTAIGEIEKMLAGAVPATQSHFLAVKLFEGDIYAKEQLSLSATQEKELAEIIKITEKIFDDDAETILINERYDYIARTKALCVVESDQFALSLSDKIDRIITHRIFALPIFIVVMWCTYYFSIQTVGTIGTDWVNDQLFGTIVPNYVSTALNAWHVAPWMQDLILNGIIAGVGSVLGFLPQLMVLFFCMSLLEDCGYMSRIAFVMDRVFRKFGLSGKSFIPMLIATGCGVPGIMASRTIENEKDRRMTVMITTFMPCSAKLPIIALIAGAFFPQSSWIAPSAYFLGISAIILSGIALKKSRLFSGDPAPFIMELPAYHLPRMKNVLQYTFDRCKSFVKKAGTIIFAACVLVWFMSTYNFRLQVVNENQSILAHLGSIVAPLFAPLGWGDWKGAVATLTGLIAKENVLGTFGILYGAGSVSENGHEVWASLQQAYTPIAAYSFLAFNLLCAPCFASIGAIRREMASAKWTWIAISYQCGLAYLVSMVIYQVGHLIFEGGSFGIGTIFAGLAAAFIIWGIVKKPQTRSVRSPLPTLKEGHKGWQQL